jgi:anti-anti-sigma factor
MSDDLRYSEITETLLTAEVVDRADAVVVAFAGEWDMATADHAEAAVDEALDRGRPVVVLDLAGVTFFASAGLNLLVRLHRELAGKDVAVRLAGAGRAVSRPMELMGLTELFPSYTSLDDALA